MIRLLCLVFIASLAIVVANYLFKDVKKNKKWLVVGGGIAAAAAGLFLQSGFAWYMPVLAIIGVALVAALIYMKLEEREELEKQRIAEERKERRRIEAEAAVPKSEPVKNAESASVLNKIDMAKKPGPPEDGGISRESEAIQERETVPARGMMQHPEKIQVRETIKVPDDEEMPEESFSMKSIQPVGKER